jgi:hypothetical protein
MQGSNLRLVAAATALIGEKAFKLPIWHRKMVRDAGIEAATCRHGDRFYQIENRKGFPDL